MQDLIYLAATFVFFAIAILFVMACDKIIGPDEVALAQEGGAAPEPEPQPDVVERVAA